jgi:hypothetical protein
MKFDIEGRLPGLNEMIDALNVVLFGADAL